MPDIPLAKRAAIAARVQHFIVAEYDAEFSSEQVAQAVNHWLEQQFEALVDDAAELLTNPRFGHSAAFYAALEGRTLGRRAAVSC